VVVTPGAYGQFLISDDSDYVIPPSPSANVASRSLTQGTSAPIVEPDTDDLFVGLNGPVASHLNPLDLPILPSEILVESSDGTQSPDRSPSRLTVTNALRLVADGNDSGDEVVYDDAHSTMIEDISRLRISTPDTRQRSDTPSDAPSGSTHTHGYETAGSADSVPPPPSLDSCTLTKSQRRRERKRAKLRAQEATAAQGQSDTQTNATIESPKKLTKSQRTNARKKRARARKRAEAKIAQEQSDVQTTATVPPKKLTKSQKDRARKKRARARKCAEEAKTAQEQSNIQTTATIPPKKLTKSQKENARKKRARARKLISNQHETQDQPSSVSPQQQSKASKKAAKRAKKAFISSEFYLSAVQYMTNYLGLAPYPPHHDPDPDTRLAVAQALLVETGTVQDPSSLPSTNTQAKSLLKSAVHINILDYLRVRSQGLNAVQHVLFKSRGALMGDIRGKRRSAKLSKVKRLGLNHFLVNVY